MIPAPKNRFLQSQKAWENKINPDKPRIEADFPDPTSKGIIIGPVNSNTVSTHHVSAIGFLSPTSSHRNLLMLPSLLSSAAPPVIFPLAAPQVCLQNRYFHSVHRRREFPDALQNELKTSALFSN
jgi:hypothetical protein